MSVYEQRPWLKQYSPGVPADTTPEFPNALAMFRHAADRDPRRTLIHYFDAALDVGAIDRMSDALAVALGARGIGRGDRIAVYLQNVPQFVLAMLAAWKLGAIMVSVNPMLRHKEVKLILNDSGARALITLESLYNEVALEVVPESKVEFVLTTSELEFLRKCSAQTPAPRSPPPPPATPTARPPPATRPARAARAAGAADCPSSRPRRTSRATTSRC